MKNSHSINILAVLFFLLILLFSCSSDDSPETEGGSTNLPVALELNSSLSSGTAELNQTVNFSVKGSDGKDYTSKSTLYLNGTALNEKSYKFVESGSYEFLAKINNLTSNKVSITVNESGADTEPTSIILSSNLESSKTDVNTKVIFQVKGDDGIEYTSFSSIKVNGEIIDGNQYTFSQGGEHEITATYKDLNSNSLSIEVISSNYVTLSRSKALRGQEIHFEFFGPDGENATTKATFMVNGNPVQGNSFSSSAEGVYTVSAKTENGEETEAKSFEIFIPERKALFEDYTGTWCGWCPRVTNAILKLKDRTEDIVVVAIHFQDDMMIDEALDLVSFFDIEAFPHARINRTLQVPFPEDEEEQLGMALSFAGAATPHSIAINTSLNKDLLDIEVKLMSENQIPANYKLAVYVLQNGLVFPQANYLNSDASSRWYLKGDPIRDFVHDEVLEVSLTNIFGDELQTIPALEERVFTYGPLDLTNYAYSTIGNQYNANRFEVVAILLDESDTAVNAQKVTVGQNVSYE